MDTHTKGPWSAACDRDDVSAPNGIYAGDVLIAEVHDAPEIRHRMNGGRVEAPGSQAGPDALDEVDANARLMAAAPDLLEACHLALECFWTGADPGAGALSHSEAIEARAAARNAVHNALRAAIAKAEGGAA